MKAMTGAKAAMLFTILNLRCFFLYCVYIIRVEEVKGAIYSSDQVGFPTLGFSWVKFKTGAC